MIKWLSTWNYWRNEIKLWSTKPNPSKLSIFLARSLDRLKINFHSFHCSYSYSETSATSLTSLPSGSNNESNEIMSNYTCPLCSIVYQKLSDLESHVQACLERTVNHWCWNEQTLNASVAVQQITMLEKSGRKIYFILFTLVLT